MTIKTITVSDKGQIAIPVSIRESMKIEKGDEFIIMQINNKLILEKSENIQEKIKDDFKDITIINEKSLKKIWNNKQDNIWSLYLK